LVDPPALARMWTILQALKNAMGWGPVPGLVILVLYLVVGVVFYSITEEWTPGEALYFTVVTMSTVGFGDFYPTHWYSRFFTVFFILFGICVVFAALAELIMQLVEPVFARSRDALEKVFPQHQIDINGNGNADFAVPRSPPVYFAKNLAGPLLVVLIVQCLSALIYAAIEQQWNFWEAAYYCMVTATTVGYGDMTVESESGKVWSCIHIIISVCLLGALIGDVGTLREKRKELLTRATLITRKFDKEFIKQLDCDNNGKITKFEFTLSMLVALGQLDVDRDVAPYFAAFSHADKDGSGAVTMADLQNSTEMTIAHQEAVDAIMKNVGKEVRKINEDMSKKVSSRLNAWAKADSRGKTARVAPE